MLKESKLIKDDGKKTKLSLPSKKYSFNYSNDGKLFEDRIYRRDVAPILTDLPANVKDIWYYSFTEMMNNAIEHSSAKNISCEVDVNALYTRITIVDDGIGIFRNIQKYLLEKTEEDVPENECVSYLFAGRFTTAEKLHSGEGIFFTSHMLDLFAILSSGVVFTRNDFSDLQFKSELDHGQGTTVVMRLSNNSPKLSEDVFRRFSDAENGFNKTEIPMGHLFPNGYPVSRSEARRLAGMVKAFETVTLDFKGIEKIGQAFVHEFFIVLKNDAQTVVLSNVSEAVNQTIMRVKNTK